MDTRVRIVKRTVASQPKQAATDSQTTELMRNREMAVVVNGWIDEFKLRSRQKAQITLPLPHKA